MAAPTRHADQDEILHRLRYKRFRRGRHAADPGLVVCPRLSRFFAVRIDLQGYRSAAWDGSLKRRVQQYGYRYNYKASRLEADDFLGDLPGWLQPIAAAVGPYFGDQETIQQVIVNEYLPGQGIASHVDHVGCFGETVAILSLGSRLVMDFVAPGTAPQKIPFLLEVGSLLILRDEARHRWKHGIAGRKSDRVAGKRVPRGRRVYLTFRSVL